MIKIRNITKTYSKETVLKIDYLDINSGQTFGLVGNNGAGKTTLFSALLDLIKPTTGEVLNNGINVRTSEDWKSFTSAFLDESFLISYLMPEEYFYFVGELRNFNKVKVDEFLKQFEDLFNGEILGGKKFIRDLSKGNQKKVGIVAALIGDPEVIILDEPFSSNDIPSFRFELNFEIKTNPSFTKIPIKAITPSNEITFTGNPCKRWPHATVVKLNGIKSSSKNGWL